MIRFANYGCPCTRECPRRNEDCHGICESYAEWRAKHEAEKAAYFKRNKGAHDANVYLIERNIMYKRTVDRAKKCLNKWRSDK